jgi:hypothetical protein
MRNGGKRFFGTFGASILLAASALASIPASAQTGGGSGYDDYPGCIDITGNPNPYAYGCCRYEEEWGGWYRNLATHREPCTGPYGQAPGEPADSASQKPTETTVK